MIEAEKKPKKGLGGVGLFICICNFFHKTKFFVGGGGGDELDSSDLLD